ncbi:MAG: S41 family peptidase [Bacteroidota bacterium]
MNLFKKKYLVIVISLGILLSFGFTKVSDRDFEIVKNLDVFYSLFRELNLFYVDEPDPEKLIETGIEAMLNSLDPYTTFISESEMDNFNFMTTGKYGGIGSLIRQSGEEVIIAEPYENSPAAEAGLRAGDRIISIDGFNTGGKELSQISERLKGTPGTDVELVVKKAGEDKNSKIKITREQIQINNVSYAGVLEDNTGYIRLSNFTLGAGNEVKEAFADLKENGIDKLILDLRGNPGGLLIEAVRVCNIFIEKGHLIVSTKGKVKQWDKDHYTTLEAVDTEIPLVVLVNRGSASASEIVAGAFQDLDRAVIVGQRTFGKGLVQTTRSLKYNTQLKVTTAKYYIPSGRCIQALDYANRNEDGSVGHIPDSLISEYKTLGGRTVYDGGGIRPDISDSLETINQLALQLYAQSIIFDFATKYMIGNPVKPSIEGFTIGDSAYEDFISFVMDKNFSYETQSERALRNLMQTAKSEKYYEIAEAEFKELSEKLKHDNEKDIKRFKDEIIELINEEIISRYYFQAGRVQLSIESDPQVFTAMDVLSKEQKISEILGKL